MKFNFVKVLALAAVAFIGAFQAKAQQMPLPVDQEVRIGKLPNGLTYYIRHNEKPKGQADFYIAQKVGSILENDEQRGLAHFLEHMCFNGTKNFPGNSLIDWLETVGVKFGVNLNAYTSIDQTVYNISNVPTARESVQDSVLLILHDWADDLLLEDEEIDKERGVIHQEWRRSNVGQMRILENLLPVIYPNNKYGYRLPIGTMEVVDNFPYQVLRDYYEAWYRPDQQGIIVVGDIDVDRIEQKIIELFSPIQMPENAPVREYLAVEDNDETIYAVGADKEQTVAVVEMMFKTDNIPFEQRNDASYMIQKYIMSIIDMMLNQRLDALEADPNAPFARASADYGDFFVAKTKDAFTIGGVSKTDDVLPVLESVYRELLRAVRGGFTVSEYERAKSEYLSRLERIYNNRADIENESYVQEYVDNFLTNEPIPSIEVQYELMQQIVPNIPLQMVNMVLPELITEKNRVILAMLPEKEGVALPTPEQLAAVIASVDAEEIAPFLDEVKDEPLIPNLPAPGKIVEEKKCDRFDAVVLTLSNGVKVIVKPTTFKADEVIFNAVAKNGTSTLSDDLAADVKFFDQVSEKAGLGTYTATDVQKYLSGKQAHVSIDLSAFSREVSGASTPKDLPTLMELIYATFTESTITEDEFVAVQNRYSGMLKNQEKNPQYIFSRDLMQALFPDVPARQALTVEDIEAAKRENFISIAQTMTANAADYTFIFVGSIDLDTFRPLVEQYIATLPADKATAATEFVIDPRYDMKAGKGVDSFTTAMETPQTYVFIGSISEVPYTAKNRVVADALGQILSKRLLDTVREDMGAVYSIGAYAALSRTPGKNLSVQSSFPMKPEMLNEVLEFIEAELGRMQSDIKPEELAKVTEYMVKEATEGKEKNADWLEAIVGFNYNGVDTFNGDVETIQSVTVDDVQNLVKEILNQGSYRVVVLEAEEAAAE